MRKCLLIFYFFIGLNACGQVTPQRYDVVIHEIMADPAPVVGLPNVEWLELKNTSGRNINLQGWRIASTTSTSGAFPTYTLAADSFVIIASTTSAAALSSFGRVLAVPSFPALNNDGTTIALLSKEGLVIHAVGYISDWYGNAVKAEGGWSLEMIDAANPCSGSNNWTASTDSRGGTPGTRNAATRSNPDDVPPALLRSYLVDSATVMLLFNETIDSTSAAIAANYSISGLSVSSAVPVTPLFNAVLVKLSAPMSGGMVYILTVRNVKDCKGNIISTRNVVKAGLPQTAAKGDVVINEILFNPKPGGQDYVEFYNLGKNVLDASRLFIANRSSTGALSSLKKLSEIPLLIFPQDYIVVTEDSAVLRMQYFVKDEAAVLVIPTLPSFPDDKGTVVLLNEQGVVVDEVMYTDDWHFGLIANAEGVSLERIDPAGSSQDKANWHSAASTAGYGTPGYKNSQSRANAVLEGLVATAPKIFSPDNDGLDDFTIISYSLPENGYVANVIIFNASGKEVRRLVKNNLLGLKGTWTWDGLDESRRQLPIGTYIIYTEIFNLQGKKKVFKNVVVLARRLN